MGLRLVVVALSGSCGLLRRQMCFNFDSFFEHGPNSLIYSMAQRRAAMRAAHTERRNSRLARLAAGRAEIEEKKAWSTYELDPSPLE